MNARRLVYPAVGLGLMIFLAGCAGPPLVGPELSPLTVPAGSSSCVEWGGMEFAITGGTVVGGHYDGVKAWQYPYFWRSFRFVEDDARFHQLLAEVGQHELSAAGYRTGQAVGNVTVTGEVREARIRVYGAGGIHGNWAEYRFLVQWSLHARDESRALYTTSTLGVYSMPRVKSEKFRDSVRLGFVPALRTAFRNLLADRAFVEALPAWRSGTR